ncbi:BON domain-containing protein [Paraburkholderia sp. CNPSo 3274]|uniref:BON domain-containing protein n=1 Tax=Paraburkholderia sp. CNPSo 3274 TaxID=2940932 RepID=UPI0020B692DD|nr:BON domain-containing protein [Paraburkholderia sp. CNPSo 3274]MCP3711386.1 BON domain-containing protein [Paraburkholderia sp. CNPSo 3274]
MFEIIRFIRSSVMKFKPYMIALLTLGALTGIAPVFAQTDAPGSGAAVPSKKEMRKENHQLEAKVRHELTQTKHLDSSGITILARGGKITLEGDAPDDQQINLAATRAAGVAGVTGVKNNLHVRAAGN